METPSSFCLISRFVALLLFLFTFSIEGYGQKLKVVKEVHERPKGLEEEFQVLKKKRKVKHGSYKRVFRGDVEVIGQYENNERVGIWEFYDWDGKLVQKYDYTNSELLYNKGLISGEENTGNVPVLIGGTCEYYAILVRNLRYPADANRNGIQGKVYISFDINEKGEMVNEQVIKGIGGGCDEEALRVFKLIPDTWIPAKVDGNPVKTSMVLPVTFKLSGLH